MAPMKQQPITGNSLSEAQAMRLMHAQTAVRGARKRPQGIGMARIGITGIGTAGNDPRDRLAALTKAVEDHVIPRLLGALRPIQAERAAETPAPETAGAAVLAIGPDQVSALTDLVLNGTQIQANAYVCAMRDAGAEPNNLCLDLLSPTASRLGTMWEEDLCDFTQVTMGILRLANVMRLVARAFEAQADAHQDKAVAVPRALLAQMPGEQHGFGLAMVVQFFRDAGWNVRSEPTITTDSLAGLVKHQWFGVAGLSVSCTERLEQLSATIRAIRGCSCNRAIGILVGGPPFIEHPHLAAMVGADATAADARQAVQQAHALLSQTARAR